jgi:putative ABC transport system substrate-binding protein
VGAQQAISKIGLLSSRGPSDDPHLLLAFRKGLNEIGFVEGQNLAIEFRWAADDNGRLSALAADLVAKQVSVIAATSGVTSARAAQAATTTIPIVFVTGVDPVGIGLVASLSRPGGNITGISNLNAELMSKRLELLHELVPGAALIGLLVNPANPNAAAITERTQAASRVLGPKLHVVHAREERDFKTVFTILGEIKGRCARDWDRSISHQP